MGLAALGPLPPASILPSITGPTCQQARRTPGSAWLPGGDLASVPPALSLAPHILLTFSPKISFTFNKSPQSQNLGTRHLESGARVLPLPPA